MAIFFLQSLSSLHNAAEQLIVLAGTSIRTLYLIQEPWRMTVNTTQKWQVDFTFNDKSLRKQEVNRLKDRVEYKSKAVNGPTKWRDC